MRRGLQGCYPAALVVGLHPGADAAAELAEPFPQSLFSAAAAPIPMDSDTAAEHLRNVGIRRYWPQDKELLR